MQCTARAWLLAASPTHMWLCSLLPLRCGCVGTHCMANALHGFGLHRYRIAWPTARPRPVIPHKHTLFRCKLAVHTC